MLLKRLTSSIFFVVLQAHCSIEKVARVMGLRMRIIDSDENHSLRGKDVLEAIKVCTSFFSFLINYTQICIFLDKSETKVYWNKNVFKMGL